MIETIATVLLVIVFVAAFSVGICTLMAFPVEWAWNLFAPAMHLPTLTFPAAFGVTLLILIIASAFTTTNKAS